MPKFSGHCETERAGEEAEETLRCKNMSVRTVEEGSYQSAAWTPSSIFKLISLLRSDKPRVGCKLGGIPFYYDQEGCK